MHKWSKRWGGNGEIKGIAWRRPIRKSFLMWRAGFPSEKSARMWSG